MTWIKKFNSCGWSRWGPSIRNDFVSYVSVKLYEKKFDYLIDSYSIPHCPFWERNSLLFAPFIRRKKSSWLFHFAYWGTHKSEKFLINFRQEKKIFLFIAHALIKWHSKFYNHVRQNLHKDREKKRSDFSQMQKIYLKYFSCTYYFSIQFLNDFLISLMKMSHFVR